ncbi:MAG TPA: sigma-E processing peptidase SpoIIGA [Bacillota bacterium]|nr:sigma-E processing peptidase SpoIIGA [Bacillota bacterium]
MGYLYADLYFLTNLGMNFVTLWLAARLGRLPTSAGRLALASATGGAYALALLVPSLDWLFSPPGRLLFSLLMVGMAFSPRTFSDFGRAAGWFYAVTLVTGGTALAMGFLTRSPQAVVGGVWVYAGGVRWWILAAALVGGVSLLGSVLGEMRRKWRVSLLVPMELTFGQETITLPALVDTGNRLRDPLTGCPAVIVEATALSGLLPAGVQVHLKDPPDLAQVASGLEGTHWAARIRVVPFQSIGQPAGLLMGFRTDAMVLRDRGREFKVADVVVCACSGALSAAGEYRALLNPDLLEEGERRWR